MRPGRATGAFLAVLLAAAAARADEDKDLELIPETVRQAPEQKGADVAGTSDARQRIYLESAFTIDLRRELLVPLPPPASPDWQERLFLDARKEWALGGNVALTYSGRLNLVAQDNASFPTHQAIRHDFREGYLSWQALPGSYLDAGRINVKSGVAAGFNPTDFFKTRTVVEPLSADPAVLREDRLGTFMVGAQHIAESDAVALAYAPALYRPSRIYGASALPSFNPMLDRTNPHDRLLLKGNARVTADFSPELLVYHEGGRTQAGANLAESVGQSTTLYAEWAGGRRASLIADALHYGTETGTIPAGAPAVLPFDRRSHFQNDLAVGASYATESKIVFNLEYNFHQAGFSDHDWRNWFAVGTARRSLAPVTSELWFIRSYALDQQEPTATHTFFLRADRTDAFIPNLELSGFARVDLRDGSSLLQATADYYLSNAWTMGALAAASIGGRRSDQGSLSPAASVIFKVARYF